MPASPNDRELHGLSSLLELVSWTVGGAHEKVARCLQAGTSSHSTPLITRPEASVQGFSALLCARLVCPGPSQHWAPVAGGPPRKLSGCSLRDSGRFSKVYLPDFCSAPHGESTPFTPASRLALCLYPVLVW